MNEITNKFLLAGSKFMPEMHLRDPIVGTYSACGPFTKNKNLWKHVIQDKFTKINWTKLVFNMIWHITSKI